MRKKATKLRLDAEFLDYLRDAAAHVGMGISVTSIVEDGARKELLRLEREHGGLFPPAVEVKMIRGGPGNADLVIRLPEDMMERIRNAAAFLEKSPSHIASEGAEKEVAELERTYNKGKKFPRRPVP